MSKPYIKKRIKDRKLLDEVKLSPCTNCGSVINLTPAHIKTRGSGGDDTKENVISLCMRCHIHQTHLGWKKFIDMHPKMLQALARNGWQLVEEFGVWKLRRK